MLSRRLPASFAATPWSERLAAARTAGGLLDLTESNPTVVGLGGAGAAELAALADPRGAAYRPDPRGLPEARAALAAALAASGTPVDPADLVLTSGTSESYAHLFAALCDPGDVVLAPVPSYPLVEPIADWAGVRVVHYRLGWDGGWHFDPDSFDAALADAGGRARAAVVIQPNQPTGTCLTDGEQATLEGRCVRNGLVLIADEVFRESPWPPATAPLPSLLGDRRAMTAVLGGLSKSAGMPQLKLGWIALAGPGRARLGEALEWTADLFLSVGTPVQLALPALLAARPRFQAALGERLARNLSRLGELVARHPAAGVLPAVGGWVAILRLPGRRDAEGWALALLARGVAVQPGDLYDLPLPACVVVSLIPAPDMFDAACARIEAELAGA